ncbi:MAG: hypothetical protein IJZ16_11095 [Clostridia bacterium]|nr:hypothetical protein [Clostridia bacterium]
MNNSVIKSVIITTLSILLLLSMLSVGTVFATTVSNTIYSDELSVELDGISDKTVLVPVMMKNNTGIAGFELNFAYDSNIITPVEIISDENSVLTSGMINDTIENSSSNSFKVIWSGIDNVTEDGILFYINFSVNAEAIDSTTISVNYNKNNTFDENIEEVEFNCKDILIIFNNSAIDSIPKITLSSSDITAGDTFVVNGIISDVGGLTDSTIKVGYNSGTFSYELISANSNVTISNCKAENGYVTFDVSGITPAIDGTVLFTLTFKCSDTANADKYTFNGIVENIKGATEIHFIECSIKVSASATSDSAVIYSDDIIIGRYGKTLYVPVYFGNNKGLMGYKLKFEYDNTLLSPVGVTNSNLLSGQFDNNIGVHDNYFNILWNSSSEQTANGELFVIEFEVIGTAKTETQISVLYSQGDTFNEEYRDVKMMCNNISVDLNSLIGDVNCDGVTDNKDYALLVDVVCTKATLTDYQNVIADLNNDKSVDCFDAVTLDLYINNFITL